MKEKLRVAIWIVFLSRPAWLQAGALYSITDLGVLPGGSITAAASISSNGLVTGSGDSASASSQPFLWSPGAGLTALAVNSTLAFGTGINASGVAVGYMFSDDFSTYRAFSSDGADIPTLGGASNASTGINDSGTIVGYSLTTNGSILGFSYSSSGTITPLGTLPGGSTSSANAINGSGLIVGQADVAGLSYAVVFNGANPTDLGLPSGYQSSYASAVSNAGQVAGTLNDGLGGTMAFLWVSDTVTTLGALTSSGDSRAYGVNSSGDVVGSSDGVAFLYEDGGIYDLNALLADPLLGWQLTEADAINDLGQIAGTGNLNGQQHAFLLDPQTSVPEPASLLLTCGGLLLAALSSRCLRKENRV